MPEGREARFAALYSDAYLDVLRFVQRRVPPEQAEDVVADAFFVAWRSLDQAPPQAADLRAWLFGIARHVLLNERRGNQRRAALAVRVSQLQPSEGGRHLDLEAVPLQIDLAAAWKRLSAAEQEALALTVFDDLTSPQAALVLGITSTAYRLRLMRARRALTGLMDSPEKRRVPTALTEEYPA